MGGGKSSGSSTPVVTQEQRDLLKAQTGFLTDTAFPAYQKTLGMATDVYNQVNPTATDVANTAMGVAGRTGALQEAGGSQAYNAGLGGQQNVAASQQGLGGLLSGKGAGGVSQGANALMGLGGQLAGQGASGTGNLAGYQQGLGQGLTSQGASGLGALFDPEYEKGQINAALQAGRESARESQAGQNAMYGGAGGLGSSRMALADKNLSSLNAQRQAAAASGAQAQVQANKAAAAQQLLGAGQAATGQAQTAYGNLLGQGTGAMGTGSNLFGNLLTSGQGATGQAGSLYGNLAGQGAAGLTGANQAAAARIGYAQTPQDVLGKYASIIYGTPQASTTPSFQGTQGSNTSGKGVGFNFAK
jgi:hypothetical protein